jgi:hypothetical protein
MLLLGNWISASCILLGLSATATIMIQNHSRAEEQRRAYELPMPSIGNEPSFDDRPTFSAPQFCGVFRGRQFSCRPGFMKGLVAGEKRRIAIGIDPYPAPLFLFTERFLDAEVADEFRPLARNPIFNHLYSHHIYSDNDKDDRLPLPRFELTPIRKVLFGEQLRAEWHAALEFSPTFCPDLGHCSRLVRGWSNRDGQKVHGIAICEITRMSSDFSAPRACRYLTIDVPHKRGIEFYVQAVTYYEPSRRRHHAGRKDFELSLPHEKVPPFLEAADKNLQEGPFFAKISAKEQSIIATADYQWFAPLNLFVISTIDISVRGYSDVRKYMAVTTTLYVSPRTSDADHEWRMASRQQNETFLQSLKQTLRDAALNSCSSGRGKYELSDEIFSLSCDETSNK